MTPQGGDDRGRGVNYWFKPPERALSGRSHNYYSINIFNLPSNLSQNLLRLIHIVQLMTPEHSKLLKRNKRGNGDYFFYSFHFYHGNVKFERGLWTFFM